MKLCRWRGEKCRWRSYTSINLNFKTQKCLIYIFYLQNHDSCRKRKLFIKIKISLLAGHVTVKLAILKHYKATFNHTKVYTFFLHPVVVQKLINLIRIGVLSIKREFSESGRVEKVKLGTNHGWIRIWHCLKRFFENLHFPLFRGSKLWNFNRKCVYYIKCRFSWSGMG